MKPGYQTTEFWMALVVNLIAVLVLLGIIEPADQGQLESNLQELIETGGAFVTLAVSTWAYIKSRAQVKQSDVLIGEEIIVENDNV